MNDRAGRKAKAIPMMVEKGIERIGALPQRCPGCGSSPRAAASSSLGVRLEVRRNRPTNFLRVRALSPRGTSGRKGLCQDRRSFAPWRSTAKPSRRRCIRTASAECSLSHLRAGAFASLNNGTISRCRCIHSDDPIMLEPPQPSARTSST